MTAGSVLCVGVINGLLMSADENDKVFLRPLVAHSLASLEPIAAINDHSVIKGDRCIRQKAMFAERSLESFGVGCASHRVFCRDWVRQKFGDVGGRRAGDKLAHCAALPAIMAASAASHSLRSHRELF